MLNILIKLRLLFTAKKSEMRQILYLSSLPSEMLILVDTLEFIKVLDLES